MCNGYNSLLLLFSTYMSGMRDNQDKHEAGIRRCLGGNCESAASVKTSPNKTSENKTPGMTPAKTAPQTIVKDKGKAPARQQGRCGKCPTCRENCEAVKRQDGDWCAVCRKKKLEGKTGGQGCKKRSDCCEAERGKGSLSTNLNGGQEQRKRNLDSPPEKPPSQNVKANKAEAAATSSVGDAAD